MFYRNLLVTLAVALPVVVFAAQNSAKPDNTSADTDTNDKVACIMDFIDSELDADKHDTYIDDCVKQKVAARKNPAQKKG
jgi:hypothetical protein